MLKPNLLINLFAIKSTKVKVYVLYLPIYPCKPNMK